MPRTYNSTQESVIRGGYVPFLLQRDIDQASLKGAVQELNTANRQAIQQKNIIMEALSKADLNPADAAWRDAYAQQIESELAKEVIGGSYAKALPTAMELAGKVASNPELIARQKANKEYQTHKGIVDNMVAAGKLPERIAQQWMEENPYNFKPIVDNVSGKVIGGEEWRPNWRVVEPVDMTQVYAKVGQLAAEEAGGGQNVRFVDENGRPVSNPANGMYGMEIKTGSQWTRLPAEKLKRIFNAALDQIPGARETFEQDYNNKIWQYNKADEEGKRAFYGSDIMDAQGNMRSLQDYINYKADPILEGMAYNRVHSTIDYSLNNSYFSAKRSSSGSGDGDNPFIDALLQEFTDQGPATAINVPLNQEFSAYYNNLNNALKTVTDIFNNNTKTKGLINNPVYSVMFQNYVQSGDYNNLAKYLQNLSKQGFNPQERAAIEGAIRRIKTDGAAYNDMLTGLSEDERRKLDTYAAITTGAPFINAKDNKYAQEVARRRNNIFALEGDPTQKTSRPTYSDKIGLEMLDENTLGEFIRNLKIDKNELSAHGLEVKRENGKIILDVARNTDILPIIGNALQKMDEEKRKVWDFNSNWGKDRVSIVKYDKNGNLVQPKSRFAGIYEGTRANLKSFSPTSNQSIRLETDVRNILASHGKVMTVTPDILAEKTFSGKVLKDNAAAFGLKRTDVMAYDKDIDENTRNLLTQGLSHIRDFTVFDENGDMVSPADAEDLQKYLDGAIADNKFITNPALIPTGKGYAWQIVIPEFKNKDGDVQKTRTILVEGLVESRAAEMLSQDKEAMYNRAYQQARALNKTVYDINNKPILYDRGIESIEKNKFIASAELDEAYSQLEELAASGAKLYPQAIQLMAYQIVARTKGVTANEFENAIRNGTVQNIIEKFNEQDLKEVNLIDAKLNNHYISVLTSK